jgi:hypothetical protein
MATIMKGYIAIDVINKYWHADPISDISTYQTETRAPSLQGIAAREEATAKMSCDVARWAVRTLRSA